MEVMLTTEGYEEASELAQPMWRAFSQCAAKLSKQDHYDFGLRTILATAKAAGRKRRAGEGTESTMLSAAIRDMMWPGLTAADKPVAAQIITESVGDPGPPHGPLRSERISFTAAMDAAVKDSSVQSVIDGLAALRKELAVSLRGDMPADQRKAQTIMVTLLLEQEHVATDILAQGAQAADAWSAGETRFYDAEVKCGANSIAYRSYSAENDAMLVCTPLTRTFRQSFFNAWSAGKVYAAHGPAGTGKTETAKDTARAIGIDAAVVSCSNGG
jgi:hypothetical protein